MADKILKREEIEEQYKWDLSALCDGDEGYDKLVEEISALIPGLEKYKGKLGERKELLAFFKENEKVIDKIGRMGCYAMQRQDENSKDGVAIANQGKAGNVFVKYNTATSYVTPELASLDENYVKELVEDEEFADYNLSLKEALRVKAHTLSAKEENLLALGGEVFGSFRDIFGMIDNADLKFGEVKNEEGELVELSHSRYGLLLASENREVRREAYEKYYETYKSFIHSIAATYIGNVKKDIYLARARNFETCLDYATFYENADKRAYTNLLKNVEKTLPAVHDYISLRKKVMGLDEIRFFDLYVPLIENDSLKLPFDEAFELVKKALAPLGEQYVETLQYAKDHRWIDIYANEGKRSGAYSVATYGVHPYVLLNYEKTVHDVFTTAHELGHAMHSYYSNSSQPLEKADYTIFVAEVASTVNEVLLLRYLIDNTDDKEMKKFCLNYFLDMYRTTLFRQTMFAEFEYIAHDKAEKGIPLTYELLSDEYEKLNKKYYGEEIIHDDCIKYEWARIPHFYRSFYVYKYATGITSAVTIAFNILEKGESAVSKYKEFLKGGCTLPPVDLLKIAGVDLTTDEPFENARRVFESTLKELKELLENE